VEAQRSVPARGPQVCRKRKERVPNNGKHREASTSANGDLSSGWEEDGRGQRGCCTLPRKASSWGCKAQPHGGPRGVQSSPGGPEDGLAEAGAMLALGMGTVVPRAPQVPNAKSWLCPRGAGTVTGVQHGSGTQMPLSPPATGGKNRVQERAPTVRPGERARAHAQQGGGGGTRRRARTHSRTHAFDPGDPAAEGRRKWVYPGFPPPSTISGWRGGSGFPPPTHTPEPRNPSELSRACAWPPTPNSRDSRSVCLPTRPASPAYEPSLARSAFTWSRPPSH
jgi:hypothetical protein